MGAAVVMYLPLLISKSRVTDYAMSIYSRQNIYNFLISPSSSPSWNISTEYYARGMSRCRTEYCMNQNLFKSFSHD